MVKVEALILSAAPDAYNALRPRNRARIAGGTEAKIDPVKARASRRGPR